MENLQEIEKLRIENALLLKLLYSSNCSDKTVNLASPQILFVDFYAKWLTYKKLQVQSSTFFEYKRIFTNYILPYFGANEKMLNNMTAEDIAYYYQYLKTNHGMTNNSLIRHHANLYTCFKYAYNQGFLEHMVMDRVQRPKAERHKGFNYYTLDELLELFTIAQGSNVYTPIILGAVLGLRRSEVLALKWDAINFNSSTVAIKRKMTRDKTHSKDNVSRNLKSEASQRTLVLPDFLLKHLQELKQNTAELPIREYAEFVCVDKCGKLPTLNMITNRFRDFLQKYGLKKIRYHDLRHSCATMLLSLGYSMKEIQEWLGHSNYQTTANIYTHVGINEKKHIAEQLQRVIGETTFPKSKRRDNT